MWIWALCCPSYVFIGHFHCPFPCGPIIRLLVKLCLIQSSTVLGLNNFCIHQFYLLEIWSCFLEEPTRYCWLESIRILSTSSSEDISVCWREGISSQLRREMMIVLMFNSTTSPLCQGTDFSRDPACRLDGSQWPNPQWLLSPPWEI